MTGVPLDDGERAAPGPFRRQLLVNTLATGAGNLWAIVVSVVALPVLLSGLGATAFGLWVLIQTFSAVTGWLSLLDAGTGVATTRTIAHHASLDDPPGAAGSAYTAIAIFAVMGLLCAVVMATLGVVVLPSLFGTPASLTEDVRVAVAVFGVQVLFDMVTMGAQACLEGLQRVDVSRATDGVRRTLVAAATAIVALLGGGLRGVAVASLVAAIVATVVSMAAMVRRLQVHRRPTWGRVREIFAYGKKVALVRPLGVLHRTMDRLVIGVMLGPSSVALVEIATQLQSGADAALSATSYAVVPSASWLHAREDRGSLRELLERGTRYSLLVTVPVALGLAGLAGPIVDLWVGPEFSAAAGLTVVAIAYTLMTAPLQVGSSLLLGIGGASAILGAALAAVVANLISSVLLVDQVGIVGAFIGTLIGAVFLIPLLGRAFLRAADLRAREFLRSAVVPCLLPTAALVAVMFVVALLPVGPLVTIVLSAAIGGVAYLAVAWRWSLQAGEVANLRSTLARRTVGGRGVNTRRVGSRLHRRRIRGRRGPPVPLRAPGSGPERPRGPLQRLLRGLGQRSSVPGDLRGLLPPVEDARLGDRPQLVVPVRSVRRLRERELLLRRARRLLRRAGDERDHRAGAGKRRWIGSSRSALPWVRRRR